MSLHIGNLSAGTRIDDLQRVFRKFGRCTVRVKDKYGFVVYDYPAGAEKALKTLRGTRICGQAITISWSKRQPQKSQRPPTGEKLNEEPHRRYSMKEYAHRRSSSYGRRENELNSHKADGKLRTDSSNLIHESTRYRPDESKPYVRESNQTSPTDHHGIGDGRKNHVNVSRWDEPAIDPLSEIYLENNLDFDRYEPHDSDGKKELDERSDISHLVGSSSVKKVQDRRGLSYNEKSQKSCYICGELGHKRSNCPLQPKRHVSDCRPSPHPSGDTFLLSSQESDRKPTTSKTNLKLLRLGDSSTQEISPRGRGNELKDKKRNWRDYESQDKSRFQRAIGPSSSSIHSNYTSSRSQSPSRPYQPSSRFKLKSIHSEKISLPSSYGSSPSRHSGYKTLKSPRSKAGSMSPSSSLLPKEVNHNVSPSPNKAQGNSKGSLANVVAFQQCADLFEEETQLVMPKDSSGKDNNLWHSSSKGSHESCVPLLDGDGHIVDNLSLHSMKGIRESQRERHVSATECNSQSILNASREARMSLEEVHMVMKHYGLQLPEENEKDLPVEVYFGSARFWPWEMIYYRRLKKGPISAENYSRRSAQNAEYGIVDRHVRGSSGWGELHENS
ncbi:serine/arginine-rich splicing factor 4-like [Salvia splendens]|uniref:serine/arginine-rich splicing factor 4-like n=1 Tax=Salvia splendens TaxID=180675 RepID=UPI001C273564|nr:serine/arginine-rich splicing factor 4-like [Salvia splendens]XP_042041729.1 serine/arginine-rich splicing factor 4-like [Salvia splendens]XP_042041730.1 serine/arginine-rich splicing factor 4-like [Salvia splendens]XP_042041731.1 serine/arginine-rich splicing factor 4-like [Salvia splendens]XP_042041732.1 serine/arginine-rich splicing factor 4-like [Salvia splendens]XP_042041733.1 serine/arginine-rich splicing factor 4-like [Salvia splendens]